jgi:class 3 adenylate cyclase
MRGPWKAVRHLLPALAAVSSGLLTGAMLFIGLDVAPWARSLSPWEFDAWIWSYGPSMRHVVFPMGLLSTLLVLAALAFSRDASAACRKRLLLATGCLLAPALLHVSGLEPIDPARADSATVSRREEIALVDREILWHWLQLGLDLAAFLATLSAVRLRETDAQRERIDRLKRFFSPALADLIVRGGDADPLKTHRREVTVVFLDLRDFTAFGESAEPEEVMTVLREYHARVGPLVLAGQGTLERFTGDGMMIFFNDPVPVANPCERAVRMALAVRAGVDELRVRWRRRGFELDLGVGIAQGPAMLGAIGFDGRWDYGAIGTVTNTAARLCAEALPGQILVTRRVLADVADIVRAQPVGALALKGLSRPVPAFNVVGLRVEAEPAIRRTS